MTLPDRVVSALADRYAIVRELGGGGMATVYLAEDLRHRRKVAIKVLREDLSASVGSARFLREIEIAAQLQHPNILPLLDSGSAEGRLFYVMPFMEGQSLRQRLDRERELPVHDAVRILTEVVDALAHAHKHGVVHRDIKPDNVMLSGRHAVVADFGIARAVSESTSSSTITSIGIALGTPAYMAPEQATADPAVDHRADIYAVGALAYELLSGRQLFTGMTPQQVLAAHVTQAPDPLARHRAGISPALEQTVMRCLEKRPADRWQSADDLLAALEPLATPSGGSAPTSARMAARPTTKFKWIGWAVAALLLVAAAVAAFMQFDRPSAITSLGTSSPLTADPGMEIVPEISPDGKFVAYSTGTSASLRVFVRPVDGGRAIPLSLESSVFEYQPRWSPDGNRILFLNGRFGVSVAPAFGEAGSATEVVAPRGLGISSADWSPSGDEIAFVYADTLSAIKLNGGATRVIAIAKDLNTCAWSPDPAWIACAQGNSQYTLPGVQFGNLASSVLVLVPAQGGEVVPITNASHLNHSPAWSSDGRLLFFVSNRDGPRDVYVQEIRSGGVRGAPKRLTTGLNVQSLSLSVDDSRVAYSVYQANSNIWSVPFPKGASVSTDSAVQLTRGNQIIEVAKVTPDRKWLVYDSNIRGNSDIWRIPINGGTPEQLTNEPFDEFAPDVSPDGRELAYHAFRTPGFRQVEVKPITGGTVEQVTAADIQLSNAIWSPDGQRLVFFEIVPPFRFGMSRRTAPGQWTPVRILGNGVGPRFMRDGSIIWGSVEPVRGEIGVVMRIMPADSGQSRELIGYSFSEGIPVGAEMSRDGQRVFIKRHDAQGHASIWSLPVAGGKPVLLVRFPDLNRGSFRPTFTTDEQRIFFTIDDRQSDVYVSELIRK